MTNTEPMNILAIDTATEACSAALLSDGETASRFELAPRRHTELLLPMVDELLAEAGMALSALDAVAFGRGPGSFTGVRIATATAQGIAYSADLPVVPVSTLAAIAQAAMDRRNALAVACAMDARMGEVYWATFRRGADGPAELEGEERVLPPSDVPLLEEGISWHGAGSGWEAYHEALIERLGATPATLDTAALPHAATIARLAAAAFKRGETVSPAEALPVYLRNKVTHQRTPQM